MEIIYTAYSRTVNNVTTYFVKRFTAFPELAGVSPVQEAMGMHTDFEKACSIAGVTDLHMQKLLWEQASENNNQAKVIDISAGFIQQQRSAGL